MDSPNFWNFIDRLVAESRIVIDRPKGSSHPRYPNATYPVDYGYLDHTTSMDGGGIDVWVGSMDTRQIDAIVCTVDLLKRDSEIKILVGCTEAEKQAILHLINDSDSMCGLLVQRQEDGRHPSR